MTENVGQGLPQGWKANLISWAQSNGSVSELWLFGDRAKGAGEADSEVDLGLTLMRAKRGHDWAFGNFVTLHNVWRGELEAILGLPVNLVPMIRDNEGADIIRSTGICLWQRKPT
jgi:predicted nucleotidyltransferase